IWEKLKENYHLPENTDSYVKQYFALRNKMVAENGGIHPMEGVVDLIRCLNVRKVTLAIASGSSPEDIKKYRTDFGISDCFQTVVSGCECKKGKPDPEIYLRVAEKIGYDPGKCIVIEDSVNGMKAAKAAGMYCIGYVGKHSFTKNLSYADRIIHHFDELRKEVE
ncbi:MAG: HAD-IA family hydrolase, partial [Eubacterium sp.]|nr:HAD-IA family hydrolase [Eubacterium sp.]